jgi:hypothetical protein
MLTVHHHNHSQNSDTERNAMKMTIQQFDRNSMRLLAGACSLFTLLALAPAAFAQQGAPALGGKNQVSAATAFAPQANNQAASPAVGNVLAAKSPVRPVSAEEENTPANPAKPSGEGVKVHGHWVIDVRNPDGTLVQHREFENSLQQTGAGFLVGLLSGYMTPGDYMIQLGAAIGNGPCAGADYQICGLVHNINTSPAINYCYSLYCTGSSLSYTYNFGTAFAGPFSTVLSGSITANQTGNIGTVETVQALCSNLGASTTVNPGTSETTSPATCVTQTTPQAWVGELTGTTLGTPIPVVSGQIVQVTVAITFS